MARSLGNKWLSLGPFSANPNRMARTRFAKSGGGDVKYLLVQRIWDIYIYIYIYIYEEDSRCEEDWMHRYLDEAYLEACRSCLEGTEISWN